MARFSLTALMIVATTLPVLADSPPPIPLPSPDACGASGFQALVGRSQPFVNILTGRDNTRVIRPGDMVTMDYLPQRMNVVLDENDVIERIYCG